MIKYTFQIPLVAEKLNIANTILCNTGNLTCRKSTTTPVTEPNIIPLDLIETKDISKSSINKPLSYILKRQWYQLAAIYGR